MTSSLRPITPPQPNLLAACVRAAACGLLTVMAIGAHAQDAPPPQEKGPAAADAMLHALNVEYKNPYRPMSSAEIKSVLDRVFTYLDTTTPAKLIDKRTNAEVALPTQPDPNVVLKPGDFRLTSYEWGVTYAGMLAAGEATGDKRYTDYTVTRHQLLSDLTRVYAPAVNADPNGSAAPIKSFLNPHALDDAGALCMSFMKAKNAGSTVDYGKLVDICGKFVTEKEYRFKDGTIARGGPDGKGGIKMRPLPNTLWLDDMFMGVPTIALMGKYTGQQKYYDDAVKQVTLYSKRMFNPTAGVYMHGWVEGMKDHPEMRWARANGWAVMAMVEVLDVLPKTHKGYKVVQDQLRAHIRGLANLQHKDGLWHQLLDRNDTYLETSATAIYAYSIAKAINGGHVDAQMYGPMVNLAWNAIASKVTARGEIEGICVGTGMAFDPAFYAYRPVNLRAAHGYGPLLLAGAEVIKLNKAFKFGLNDSGLMYQGKQ